MGDCPVQRPNHRVQYQKVCKTCALSLRSLTRNRMRNKEHRFEASQMKFGRVPSKYIKESWGKLAFYLFSFFYYLYWCVCSPGPRFPLAKGSRTACLLRSSESSRSDYSIRARNLFPKYYGAQYIRNTMGHGLVPLRTWCIFRPLPPA
jgi:hypothetical protein